jgi:hypothetical protein
VHHPDIKVPHTPEVHQPVVVKTQDHRTAAQKADATIAKIDATIAKIVDPRDMPLLTPVTGVIPPNVTNSHPTTAVHHP